MTLPLEFGHVLIKDLFSNLLQTQIQKSLEFISDVILLEMIETVEHFLTNLSSQQGLYDRAYCFKHWCRMVRESTSEQYIKIFTVWK